VAKSWKICLKSTFYISNSRNLSGYVCKLAGLYKYWQDYYNFKNIDPWQVIFSSS